MSMGATKKARWASSWRSGCAVAALGLALAAAPVGAVLAAGQGAGAQQGGGHGAAGKGMSGQKGKGSDQMTHGKGGKSLSDIFREVTGEEDDSDRPSWAGTPGGKDGAGGGKPSIASSKRGDLFGDLWVILRDSNGVPILTPEGFVQPLDANGDPIPLDAEGAPVDESLVVEVELGRLNVGRAPTQVLDRRADEVVALLNSATDIALDPAGRLVLTVDGVAQTIDSPLENLAIYVALMTTGSIPDVSDLPGDAFDFMVDGQFTIKDVEAAAAFLAAATDKSSAFTSDEIAYINAFLDINTKKVGDVVYTDMNFSTFTYDRSTTFDGVTAVVLIEQADGSFKPTEVDIYEAVFADVNATASGSLDAFTQAADDARLVIDYLHEYAVPVSQ
ncbi:MAG: hypothetical protein KDC18_10940 [Alphaproteobacteria bacterium]|nr:hypothetical protein [Alphaproteobacteria bacterium]MCB9927818.1 hypothetical protein [Alphaproteobacteria bacterium]